MTEKIVKHVAGEAAAHLMDAINELCAVRSQMANDCLEEGQPVVHLEKHLRDGLKMVDLLLP